MISLRYVSTGIAGRLEGGNVPGVDGQGRAKKDALGEDLVINALKAAAVYSFGPSADRSTAAFGITIWSRSCSDNLADKARKLGIPLLDPAVLGLKRRHQLPTVRQQACWRLMPASGAGSWRIELAGAPTKLHISASITSALDGGS